MTGDIFKKSWPSDISWYQNIYYHTTFTTQTVSQRFDACLNTLRTVSARMAGTYKNVEYVFHCIWTHSVQNGRLFADDIFKYIFLNEKFLRILIRISLTFVPGGQIDNNSASVSVMAWHRTGDKPLPESMVLSSPTHICGTRGRWVNTTTSLMRRLLWRFVFCWGDIEDWDHCHPAALR